MAAGDNSFDYIIVGAGSAGCVLANRLSGDPNVSVALIEAGPTDHGFPQKFLIDLPAGIWSMIANPRYNWSYTYETDATRSAIAPFPARAAACSAAPAPSTAWSISAATATISTAGRRRAPTAGTTMPCCPISRKSENYQHGASDYHGVGGELSVSDQRDPNPVGADRDRGARRSCSIAAPRFQRRRAGRFRLLAGDAEARPARLRPRARSSIRRATAATSRSSPTR